MIVICSEHPDSKGTSVCNAFEIIYGDIVKKMKKDKWAKELDDFNQIYLESNNLVRAVVSYTIRAISKLLRNEESILKRLAPNSELLWVEHWPKEIFGKEKYFEVKHNENGEKPQWIPVELEEFSYRVGYSLSDIDKSDIDF